LITCLLYYTTLIGKLVVILPLSNISVYGKSTTITSVTIVLLSIIAAATLLEFNVIPLILTAPVFLIPVSGYITILGLNSKKGPHMTQDYSYHFTWAGILLVVGIEWIFLYEKIDVIVGVIAGLGVALGFVYLNRFKSRIIQV
jgi:hypothetical protein